MRPARLALRPEWILAVLILLIKLYLYAAQQDLGFCGVHQLWPGILLLSAQFDGQNISWLLLFAELTLQAVSLTLS